jgi:signal transduction histidine kinase
MESEIARMSHVLRGSLQTTLLNVQSLAVTLDDAETQESIRIVREELLRAGQMLLAAFEVCSLELGEVTRTNLKTLVTRALHEGDVEGVVVSPGPWPDVVGDVRLLGLAIAELARNARAATPPGKRPPEIHAASTRGGRIVALVRDWGRGFGSVEPPGRAFSSSRPGHTATGLLTVERIARLHRGSLSFETSSRGTTVSLALPLPPRTRAERARNAQVINERARRGQASARRG